MCVEWTGLPCDGRARPESSGTATTTGGAAAVVLRGVSLHHARLRRHQLRPLRKWIPNARHHETHYERSQRTLLYLHVSVLHSQLAQTLLSGHGRRHVRGSHRLQGGIGNGEKWRSVRDENGVWLLHLVFLVFLLSLMCIKRWPIGGTLPCLPWTLTTAEEKLDPLWYVLL